MSEEGLLEEMRGYSDDDLRLIIETQKELYTSDEMAVIKKELQGREQKRQERILANLPEKLICPKCDGENPFENDFCQYCGCEFDKSRFFQEGWDKEEELLSRPEKTTKHGYAFHYIISFLIPLVGFIVGAIMLGKDYPEQRAVGKGCIILGVLSLFGGYIIVSILIGGTLLFIG